MLFIDRLPFARPGVTASNVAWLPLVAQDPDDPGLPSRRWRPTAWLLDTGCSGPGWVENPFALRQFGVAAHRVRELIYPQSRAHTVSIADGSTITVRPTRLKLWLRSNLEAYRNWPYPLEAGIEVADKFDAGEGELEEIDSAGAFLLGMAQLHQAKLRVYVNARDKCVSVWVDRDNWKVGCKFGNYEVFSRRTRALMRRRLDVWRVGDDPTVLQKRPH